MQCAGGLQDGATRCAQLLNMLHDLATEGQNLDDPIAFINTDIAAECAVHRPLSTRSREGLQSLMITARCSLMMPSPPLTRSYLPEQQRFEHGHIRHIIKLACLIQFVVCEISNLAGDNIVEESLPLALSSRLVARHRLRPHARARMLCRPHTHWCFRLRHLVLQQMLRRAGTRLAVARVVETGFFYLMASAAG